MHLRSFLVCSVVFGAAIMGIQTTLGIYCRSHFSLKLLVFIKMHFITVS